ncbi:O-antigen ligase family protein [Porifericola rhodea]|uniref:O-antigen ligase family protein n=1 Tax=Porifericola rhodea TaxID=930972 RepID=UPI002666DB18|nr:O-antigen ligase family protein [Porifericola rhodea]WKN32529.1 O-antigen ligase family protein [Porifericola rhodea]
MDGIDNSKSSQSFNIAYKLLLILLLTRFFLPIIQSNALGEVSSEVGIEGYIRVLSLGILSIFLLHQMSRFSFIFTYEKGISLIAIAFVILVGVQFFILGDKSFNLQGAVKYFFYFSFIIVSLFSAINHPEHTINTIVKISLILFVTVLIFYPYLIIESGIDPVSALLYNEHRLHFLLHASNEDAHFMTTFFLLALYKVRKYPVWILILSILFIVALIYNGTRSAFIIALILPILYFILYKRRFILSTIIAGVIFIVSFSYVSEYIEVKFEEDLRVFEQSEKVLSGKEVGGSFSYRIAHLWIPMLTYTTQESPIIGNGSNGWDIVAVNILNNKKIESPHNTFVWAYVNWGIIGVIGITLLLSIPFFSLIKLYMRSNGGKYQSLIIILICTWIEFFVWSMIANAYTVHGWVVLSLLIVLSVAVKYAVYNTFDHEKESQSLNYKYS